ncbi:hypothetical protein AAFF_G00178680 [Aldrovandia affinis]|uniref:Uncharacterized protein n=1 Tax=Aldrovandia affinis TaxID=143900 RepID=A0AAD7RKD6_9TELE|nr:hypothetical protein AAFF_G00178680 [Aldrovandia affinis]
MSTITLFLSEVRLWTLLAGIFLPVSLLLILMIAYLRCELIEVEAELAEARCPRDTAYQLCHRRRRTAGEQTRT